MVGQVHHELPFDIRAWQPSGVVNDIERAASGDTEARDRLRVFALRLRWMGLSRDAAKLRKILRRVTPASPSR
jgi:hypothetical protein